MAEQETIAIYPRAGDVIFCTGNKFIKNSQRVLLRPNPKITHVAIVVSECEIAEGMISKQIELQDITQWLEGRLSANPNERLRVLRKDLDPTMSLEIQRSVTFYLQEQYGLYANLDWQTPGRSICTTFVAKALVKASVVPNRFSPGEVMFPGNLFRLLKDFGYREIPVPYFLKGISQSAGRPSADRLSELEEILGNLESAMSESALQMTGWLSVARRDFNRTPVEMLIHWERMTDETIDSFSRRLADTCGVLLSSIRYIRQRGPRNWREDDTRYRRSEELLTRLAVELYELLKLLNEACAKVLNARGVKIPLEEPDIVIYRNILNYLNAVAMGANTIRVVLELS